eukprot:scaffold84480_cov36-Phaeocystis_antarctica.AAC.2
MSTAPDIAPPPARAICLITRLDTRLAVRPVASTAGPSTPITTTEPGGPLPSTWAWRSSLICSRYSPGSTSTTSYGLACASAAPIVAKLLRMLPLGSTAWVSCLCGRGPALATLELEPSQP